MPRSIHRDSRRGAFTLIELLVVISIISLLISILLPSLSRAREQAKSVHCLARFHEYGVGLQTYTSLRYGLPTARWTPTDLEDSTVEVEYGWAELLFAHAYREKVDIAADYPAQRNLDGQKWERYFICQAVGDESENSGHYRVYLPAWSWGTYTLDPDGTYGDDTHANPNYGVALERIRLRLPILGDANDRSERGDGIGNDDCSYIDGGEANTAGSNSATTGNRFSDRHYGGTNFLFPDLHASRETKLREELAEDFDLNGVIDIEVFP